MLREVEIWTLEYPREHSLALKQIIQKHDVISKTVLSGDYSKVEFFSSYFDLFLPFSIFWGEKCETNNSRANAYIHTDIYWTSYVSFFMLRRDLIIGISYLNLTSEEKDTLKLLYYKVKTFEKYFQQYTIRYLSVSQLQIWDNLYSLPETIETVELFENISFTFENNFILDIEITEFEELIEYLLEVSEKVDSYEKFDPNDGVYEKFAISLVGVLFELFTAISLIWMAIPIMKLLVAFHHDSSNNSSNNSTNNKHNDTELSKTSTL
jgi:hypothetical protein